MNRRTFLGYLLPLSLLLTGCRKENLETRADINGDGKGDRIFIEKTGNNYYLFIQLSEKLGYSAPKQVTNLGQEKPSNIDTTTIGRNIFARVWYGYGSQKCKSYVLN